MYRVLMVGEYAGLDTWVWSLLFWLGQAGVLLFAIVVGLLAVHIKVAEVRVFAAIEDGSKPGFVSNSSQVLVGNPSENPEEYLSSVESTSIFGRNRVKFPKETSHWQFFHTAEGRQHR